MMDTNSDWLATRVSLLSRLKQWDDHESWAEFFRIYGKLIYTVARRAGLRDPDAHDVVQETILSVAKQMKEFQYDRARSSFRGWLFQLVHWRIVDRWRQLHRGADSPAESGGAADESAAMPESEWEKIWAEEWGQAVLDRALERVKNQVTPKQFQIFHLYVVKEWPVERVVASLDVSPSQVYLAKHRIGPLLKREIAALQEKLI